MLLCLVGEGGAPSQGGGYPAQLLMVGYPIPGWGGVPQPGLDGLGVPHLRPAQDTPPMPGMGYPPNLGWGTPPPSRPGWGTPPLHPPQIWDGVPPSHLPDLDRVTPPDLDKVTPPPTWDGVPPPWNVNRHTPVKTVPSLVLRTRAVITGFTRIAWLISKYTKMQFRLFPTQI